MERMNAFDEASVGLTQPRKESVGLKICEYKHLKLTLKQKKKKFKNPRIVRNFKKCNIHEIGIPEGKERETRQKKYLK